MDLYRFLRVFAGACFLTVLSVSPNVQAQRVSRLVEEVRIVGNRRLSAQEILSHLKTKVGNPYRPRQVQRDLQGILDLGWFDRKGTHVSTESGMRGGVVLIFEVEESPIILDVKFEGLGDIPKTDVIDALRSKRINLTRDAVFDIAQVPQARSVIQRVVALHGRPNTTVNLLTENVTSMSIRLTFVIVDN